MQFLDHNGELFAKYADHATGETKLEKMDSGIASLLRQGRVTHDAGLNLHRSLEFHKAYVYKRLYQDLRGLTLFPYVNEGKYGTEFLTHKIMDRVGQAQWISDYGQDMPKADASLTEKTLRTADFGTAFEYNIKEIASSQISGVPIKSHKAEAAKMAHDEFMNRLVFFGDADRGIEGFFSNADIPRQVAAVGASSNTSWDTKTPEEIFADVEEAVNGPWEFTKMLEAPTHLMMSPRMFRKISTQNWNSTNSSNITTLEYIKMAIAKTRGVQLTVESVNECSEAENPTISGGDALVAYTKKNEKLEFVIVQDLTFRPLQERNFSYISNGYASVAGMRVTFPRSALIMTGC